MLISFARYVSINDILLHGNHTHWRKLFSWFKENVSCLNTTLVFLMFANQKNQLPSYLQQLRDEKEDMLDVNGSVSVMRNFR